MKLMGSVFFFVSFLFGSNCSAVIILKKKKTPRSRVARNCRRSPPHRGHHTPHNFITSTVKITALEENVRLIGRIR